MRIGWADEALADLRSVEHWLDHNASPEIATRTLIAIRQRATFLERFPRGGRPYRDDVRILRVLATPYLLIYRLTGTQVQVLRVHHERQDWLDQ